MIPLPLPLSLPDDQYIPDRPLVLLAGWLGCQPTYLKFYARIYASAGYSVMIRIASPATIVLASTTTTPIPRATLGTYDIFNRPKAFILGRNTRTMEDIALETIKDISNSHCCSLVIHTFSNGGAFLWEAMRRTLYSKPHPPSSSFLLKDYNGSIKSDLSTCDEVRHKLIGIIFDSSPADYSMRHDLFAHALQHCSYMERIRVKFYIIIQKMMKGGNGAGIESTTTRRATEFWSEMLNFAATLPELYIYSSEDSLTPPDSLRELIEKRRRKFGENQVQSREFDSAHCCHGLTYPVEYTRVVESFLDQLGRSRSSRQSNSFQQRKVASTGKRWNEDFIRSRL